MARRRQGNLIDAQKDGVVPLGNGGYGIHFVSVPAVQAGDTITATATDADDNPSEVSPPEVVA